MDITQLKSLAAVATLGNLSRAAQSLHLSQPAVSAHIKALEDELKLTLFARHARGMKLTPEGERVFAHAKTVLAAVDAIKDEAGAISGKIKGSLVIGTINNAASLRLPVFLKLMRERAPEVEVSLIQTTSGSVLRKVLEGSFDAGFIEGDAEGADLRTTTLTHADFVVAYPAAWRERLQNASAEDIFRQPWIGTTEDCSFHRLTAALFETHGFRFAPTVRTDDEALLLDLVRQEAGVSLLRSDLVGSAAARERVAIFPGLGVTAGIQFISSRHTPKQGAVAFAHKLVAEVWGRDS